MHHLEDATVQAFCDENSLRGIGSWGSEAVDWWGNVLGITTPRPSEPPEGSRRYQQPSAEPAKPVSPATEALVQKLMSTPNESTGMQLMYTQQYMALGVPEAQARLMAAQQVTAQLKGPIAQSIAKGAPFDPNFSANYDVSAWERVPGGGGGIFDGGSPDGVPQIFGVKWYWIALGAAVGVVLLARK